MRIYISGAVSGIRGGNRRAFEKAEKKLREAFADIRGLEIVNPIRIGESVDGRFAEINKTLWQKRKPEWEDYMRECVKALADCGYAYFIKGWRNSRGASEEHHIALTLGIKCAESISELKDVIGVGRWK
jgi:hypothetical protein